MKIYHTETQEDYDALMIELEAQGCKWQFPTEENPTEKTYWHLNREKTCVRVPPEGKMRIMSKKYCSLFHTETPIIKYKAKADEKMRFNKQNIERAFDKFMQGGNDSFADLKERIINLVDEPEKVVVPKFVADYLEERKRDGDGLVTSLYPFQGNSGELIEDWFEEEENNVSFAKAWIDGYTIEPEKLYYIPLPHLETSDGLQQVLSKHKNDTHYFASRPTERLQQRYTKVELEQVPEVYKPYAKPIEEEEE